MSGRLLRLADGRLQFICRSSGFRLLPGDERPAPRKASSELVGAIRRGDVVYVDAEPAAAAVTPDPEPATEADVEPETRDDGGMLRDVYRELIAVATDDDKTSDGRLKVDVFREAVNDDGGDGDSITAAIRDEIHFEVFDRVQG